MGEKYFRHRAGYCDGREQKIRLGKRRRNSMARKLFLGLTIITLAVTVVLGYNPDRNTLARI